VTLTFGVIFVALATLFFLTTLACSATGTLRHPLRVVAVLAALLAIGLALLLV
jgi:hypothetical protein